MKSNQMEVYVKAITTILLGLAVLTIGFWSADIQASPNGPNNNWTGSPPNNANCTQCHSTFPVNSGAGSITVSGLPASYTPGTVYPLTLTVADPQAMRWGFQITALDPLEQTAGDLSVSDPVNTQLNPFLPMDVIMHTNTGTYAGTPASGSWSFDWTAPTGSDDATFYFAGNAADNAGGTTGDYIYVATEVVPAAASYPSWTIDTWLNGGSPVPAGGGNLLWGVYAQNTSGQVLNGDVWVDSEYEGGTPTLLISRALTNYQPGWAINRPDNFYPVQGSWPGGNYEWFVRTGVLPDVIWEEASFAWTKASAADSGFDFEGNLPLHAPNPFDQISTTQVDYTIPQQFEVMGAYPNPFNPTTNISFALPEGSKVLLNVYDVSGRLMSTLVDGYRNAGVHEVTFDASDLSSGVYLYSLSAGEFSATGKMVLTK
ncbi:hypothetical protein CEE37_05240 [candidate division LCP-89 bacterium B3_LCP]|uniref:Secretion system C-terminal sorting domain-containing protein n=1 Tax=candidate division LCP-89 bacterium B3_LCP TaxID=2012998 RepID=A0A532V1R0_UNCL8|nr:MAG: hypothetical protein CEE37_05240 [candidate division LCP-89 bacterium B3_LCP]